MDSFDIDKFLAELRLSGLDLSSNQLYVINQKVIAVDLQKLSLDEFKLFPIHSPYLSALRILILPQVAIGFPKDILQFTELTHLRMSYMGIDELPKEFYTLTKLRVIDISGNHLTSLSDDISKLQDLEVINLGGNKLQDVPDPLWALSKLQCLALGSNELQEIRPSIGSAVNLENLYLYNNQIQSLPDELQHLINLKLLSVDENPLTNLPSGIMEITSLQNFRYPNSVTFTPANYLWIDILFSKGCQFNTRLKEEPCYSFDVFQDAIAYNTS